MNKINEKELTFILRRFYFRIQPCPSYVKEALHIAIQESRPAISTEAEICITRAFLDSF